MICICCMLPFDPDLDLEEEDNPRWFFKGSRKARYCLKCAIDRCDLHHRLCMDEGIFT